MSGNDSQQPLRAPAAGGDPADARPRLSRWAWLPALLHPVNGPGPDPEGAAGDGPGAPRGWHLVAVSAVGLAAYGAVAGLFQGDGQVAVAASKAPLVVLTSLGLCAPTLWLAGALAGCDWTLRQFALGLARYAAAVTLVLLGLVPVVWLFSVSSRFLGSVVVLHVALWITAVLLARRALRRSLGDRGRVAMALWPILLVLVSLQVATHLQPLLHRAPGEGLLPRPRLGFMEHFGRSAGIRVGEGDLPADDCGHP